MWPSFTSQACSTVIADAELLLQAQEAGDVVDLVHVHAQALLALQDGRDDLFLRGQGVSAAAFAPLRRLRRSCASPAASRARRRESAPMRVCGRVPFQSRVDMGL